MLVGLDEVVQEARRAGHGVGAFNVIHLEHAEALVGAAEDAGLPVVLQVSENTVRWHGSLAPLAAATRALAEQSPARVVLHLDHATSRELVTEALARGFTSVMFDGSTLPDGRNRAETREVVRECHAAGVAVEAELGEIGGKDGVHAPGARTDPRDAATFVGDTGVDALAVAVGTSHAMTERTAALDLELIAAIREQVPVPLVLHGSSGVADDGLVAAVRAGMTKVNIATHLQGVFTGAVREVLDADPRVVDTRRYLAPARDAVRAEAARLLALLALR
ncbi:ketose-bisphosphate aldolase [Pedococcus sp. NPDC057267]|uniref:class II fructose-bisphosphate aldolase n=1 Tax=Pedococcus sp. NPDC057267 TaxID=3346077 RepID=UPI00362505E3